jgi:two-component system, NarL family, invasion response regulator UvrY
MFRVLVVDDRPLFADGVRRIALNAGIAIEEPRYVSTQDFMPLQATAAFDTVVIGIASPGLDDGGLSALRSLGQAACAPPVLAVCTPCDSVYGVRLLRLGARSVVAAQAPEQEIATALSRTLAGRRYLSEALAEHLVAHVVSHRDGDGIRLRDAVACDAQLRIVQLIALGKPLDVICSTLRISADAAHAHRHDILRRTGLADEQELKRQAFEQRLIPDRRGRSPSHRRLPSAA